MFTATLPIHSGRLGTTESHTYISNGDGPGSVPLSLRMGQPAKATETKTDDEIVKKSVGTGKLNGINLSNQSIEKVTSGAGWVTSLVERPRPAKGIPSKRFGDLRERALREDAIVLGLGWDMDYVELVDTAGSNEEYSEMQNAIDEALVSEAEAAAAAVRIFGLSSS